MHKKHKRLIYLELIFLFYLSIHIYNSEYQNEKNVSIFSFLINFFLLITFIIRTRWWRRVLNFLNNFFALGIDFFNGLYLADSESYLPGSYWVARNLFTFAFDLGLMLYWLSPF